MQIVDFINSVQAKLATAQKCAASAVKHLNNVLLKNYSYTDDYLKVKTSFFEIIASVATLGRSINDPLIVKLLGDIINKKVTFSGASGAWEQYEHLASWLTYLGSLLDIGPTAIRQNYLDAVYHSMRTMSRSLSLGYSWHAYSTWNREWLNLIPNNRMLIKNFIPTKTSDPDAIRIINKT